MNVDIVMRLNILIQTFTYLVLAAEHNWDFDHSLLAENY